MLGPRQHRSSIHPSTNHQSINCRADVQRGTRTKIRITRITAEYEVQYGGGSKNAGRWERVCLYISHGLSSSSSSSSRSTTSSPRLAQDQRPAFPSVDNRRGQLSSGTTEGRRAIPGVRGVVDIRLAQPNARPRRLHEAAGSSVRVSHGPYSPAIASAIIGPNHHRTRAEPPSPFIRRSPKPRPNTTGGWSGRAGLDLAGLTMPLAV